MWSAKSLRNRVARLEHRLDELERALQLAFPGLEAKITPLRVVRPFPSGDCDA
jgi:hypothetical protein